MSAPSASLRSGHAADRTQQRYAFWLDLGTKAGLAITIAGFVAYVAGLLPSQVPAERLPELWRLPLAQYLAATGNVAGWDWLARLERGDMLALAGIAVLAGCSGLAVAAVVPLYARSRWPAMAWICGLQIGVLLLAALDVFGGGH